MRKFLLSAFTLAAFYMTSFTTTASSSVEERLQALFDSRYPEASAPGAAMIVARGDEVLFERYRGVADMATGTHIDANTRFNIASVSKQFTAAAVMQLQERRMLDIDNRIIDYYPQLRADVMRDVTLRHLMSHSSGIPDARPRVDRQWMLTVTDEQSIEYLSEVDRLHFIPGTEYEYINPTFQILFDLIQRISGRRFVDYMRINVFEPAEMSRSQYFDANEDMPTASHGYVLDEAPESTDRDSNKATTTTDRGYRDAGGSLWHEYDYGEETFFATKADGGLYSTARDLLRWHVALRDARVISHDSYRAMRTPNTKVSGSSFSSYQNRPNTYYGLGLFLDTTPGHPMKVYHTGDNGGFQAYLAYYPYRDISIIVLENRNDLDRWSFATAIDAVLTEAGLLQ